MALPTVYSATVHCSKVDTARVNFLDKVRINFFYVKNFLLGTFQKYVPNSIKKWLRWYTSLYTYYNKFDLSIESGAKNEHM